MPTESELRDRMREPRPGGPGGLDADAVIRSARRRRRPKQVLAATGAGLALVAILAVPVVGLTQLSPTGGSASSNSAPELRSPGSEKSGQGAQGATTEGSSGCSADTTAVGDGPQVALADLAADSDGTVTGTVVLTGVDREDDDTLRIAAILSSDGMRVGEVDATWGEALAPDANGVARIPLSFTPVSCDGSALGAGSYTVTPVVELLVGGDAVTARSIGAPVGLTIP